MKSERLKRELIPNVSHDITPLTPIIDYVDLLKEENEEAVRKQCLGKANQVFEDKRLVTVVDCDHSSFL